MRRVTCYGRIGLGLLLLSGCRQEMARQPSYRALRPSTFFADGMSARPLVAGTVARGHFKDDTSFHTGKWPVALRSAVNTAALVGHVAGNPLGASSAGTEPPLYVTAFPMPVTDAVLRRGQERYNIFCSPCHDRVGTGHGMIVRRGFTPPPSFHTDLARGLQLRGIRQPLREVPVGYYFETIRRGFGAMPDYSGQVSTQDSWAIVAYIRALQLSQHASLEDVSEAAAKAHLLGGKP